LRSTCGDVGIPLMLGITDVESGAC
jgi:hypothetical protein